MRSQIRRQSLEDLGEKNFWNETPRMEHASDILVGEPYIATGFGTRYIRDQAVAGS